MTLCLTTQPLHWERGRLARSEHRKVRGSRKVLNSDVLFALRAHCGRAARAPSEEVERQAQVTTMILGVLLVGYPLRV